MFGAKLLIDVFRQGNPRTYCQDVCFRSRFVLIVEANRAVGAEIIRIPRFRPKSAFDSVHSASCRHFAISVHDEIDLFGGFMVVGEISATRRKVHPEKACHDISLIQGVPLSVSWPYQ